MCALLSPTGELSAGDVVLDILKFQDDGFCVIDNFLTEEEINLIKKECEEIVQRMSLSDHLTTFSTREHHIVSFNIFLQF